MWEQFKARIRYALGFQRGCREVQEVEFSERDVEDQLSVLWPVVVVWDTEDDTVQISWGDLEVEDAIAVLQEAIDYLASTLEEA